MSTVSNVRGTPYQQIQMPTKDPKAMELYQQIAQALGPHLKNTVGNIGQMAAGGTEEQWNQLEAPAMRQFNQFQGNMASRFSGAGMGSRHSSGFQNTMTGASTDLAERLQGNRMNLQQNAQSQLLGLYQNLMGTDTFDTQFLQKQKPWWQELLSSLGPAAGQAAGSFSSTAGLMKLFPQLFRMTGGFPGTTG